MTTRKQIAEAFTRVVAETLTVEDQARLASVMAWAEARDVTRHLFAGLCLYHPDAVTENLAMAFEVVEECSAVT